MSTKPRSKFKADFKVALAAVKNSEQLNRFEKCLYIHPT